MANVQNTRQLFGDSVYYSRMLCEEVIFVTYKNEIVGTVINFHEGIFHKIIRAAYHYWRKRTAKKHLKNL